MLNPDHKGAMLAFVNFNEPTRELAFHEWYNTVHLEDVKETPGVMAGHRFVNARDGGDDLRFFVIYETDTEDVNGVARRLPETFAQKQDRRFEGYAMTAGYNFRRIFRNER